MELEPTTQIPLISKTPFKIQLNTLQNTNVKNQIFKVKTGSLSGKMHCEPKSERNVRVSTGEFGSPAVEKVRVSRSEKRI